MTARAAARPSVALGVGLGAGRSVELRAAWLRTETTERIPDGAPRGDAPSTVGVRALQLGAAVQNRLPFPGERVYPVVALGASWTSVTDTWESDTLRESRSTSVWGADASAALVARLAGPASLVARGGYRFAGDGDGRPVRTIGLSGLRGRRPPARAVRGGE